LAADKIDPILIKYKDSIESFSYVTLEMKNWGSDPQRTAKLDLHSEILSASKLVYDLANFFGIQPSEQLDGAFHIANHDVDSGLGFTE